MLIWFSSLCGEEILLQFYRIRAKFILKPWFLLSSLRVIFDAYIQNYGTCIYFFLCSCLRLFVFNVIFKVPANHSPG